MFQEMISKIDVKDEYRRAAELLVDLKIPDALKYDD